MTLLQYLLDLHLMLREEEEKSSQLHPLKSAHQMSRVEDFIVKR